jgi:hypothetical protein
VAGAAHYSAGTFIGKTLRYAEVDGMAMFEGDIVLGSLDDMRNNDDQGPVLASVGITGSQFRWPNGLIPYEIDPSLPNQARVTDAIAHWQANTRIRFVQRTAANAAQFPDFVRFVPGGGCSSNVGRRGGQQTVTLGSGCTTGNAIHEIGHTVGLWHEQSREDRDTFVQIVFANIDPTMVHNFDQHVSDGDDLGAYDYGSVMHYPPNAFSINGQATIIARQALPPGIVMGQRNGLSAADIAGVHAMYPTLKQPIKEAVKEAVKEPIKEPVKEASKEPIKEPIKDGIKDVRKDPIQDTRKEIRKEPTVDTIKETRKDPIQDTIKEIRKEPTVDTVKEVPKEPIRDTVKELRKDPIQDVQPIPRPGPRPIGEAAPFVLALGNRAPAAMGDPLADAADQVQQLEQAIQEAEQQYQQLVAAYDAAVQLLNQLQGGQGM